MGSEATAPRERYVPPARPWSEVVEEMKREWLHIARTRGPKAACAFMMGVPDLRGPYLQPRTVDPLFAGLRVILAALLLLFAAAVTAAALRAPEPQAPIAFRLASLIDAPRPAPALGLGS